MWSWVSGVRVPSLTPLKVALTRGFIFMTPRAGPAGSLGVGPNAVIQIRWKARQAAVTVTVEWGQNCAGRANDAALRGHFPNGSKLDVRRPRSGHAGHRRIDTATHGLGFTLGDRLGQARVHQAAVGDRGTGAWPSLRAAWLGSAHSWRNVPRRGYRTFVTRTVMNNYPESTAPADAGN